ncbi:MAG: ThuA domain-containing protein, partial [Planctomycetia bacterium]|nr:ThuA domain-containing protein [Planctomycetia bacterium]
STVFASTPKKILYFERSTSYVHPPTVVEADGLSIAGKVLKKLCAPLGYEVVCTQDGTLFDDVDPYSGFIFYTCGELDKPGGKKNTPPMSAKGVKNFYEAIRAGKGLLGIHSATDTWKTPGEKWENQPVADRNEYTKVIGAQFVSHGSQQETTMRVVDSSLPWIGKQGKSFQFFEEWYAMKNFNPDMHVILAQETEGMKKKGNDVCYDRPAFPSTWARMEGKGRVAYTALGHNNKSWTEEVVPGVVFDLIQFILGLVDMDLTPNINKVCPGAYTVKNQ